MPGSPFESTHSVDSCRPQFSNNNYRTARFSKSQIEFIDLKRLHRSAIGIMAFLMEIFNIKVEVGDGFEPSDVAATPLATGHLKPLRQPTA